MNKEHPLILVYYASEDLRREPNVLKTILEQINMYIESNKWNIMFITLPTGGEDRLECINPVILSDEQKESVNKIISDIKRGFNL